MPTKLNSPCSSCHPRSCRILVSQCRRPRPREKPERERGEKKAIAEGQSRSRRHCTWHPFESLHRQLVTHTSGRSMPASEANELSCNPGNEPSEFELGHFGTDGTCPATLPNPPLPPLPTLQKLAPLATLAPLARWLPKLAPLARCSWLLSPIGPCSAHCVASILDLGDNASRLPYGSLCFLSCELKLPNVLKVPEPIGDCNEPAEGSL